MKPSAPATIAPSAWQAYHRATRSATYGFLSALPLLACYEVMILAVNQGRAAQVRVGAEVWLKELLALAGVAGAVVLGIGIGLVGIGILMYERKKRLPIRPRYFAWMIGESAVYAVLVAGAVAGTVGVLFAVVPAALLQEAGLGMRLALSIGAGVYEELLFRVLLVGGLYLLLRRMLARRRHAYLAAAVVGAVFFSAAHYVGTYGDAFGLASFAFRFLFGLALNGLFLWRGFGIAAWTHALYDVMLTLGLIG